MCWAEKWPTWDHKTRVGHINICWPGRPSNTPSRRGEMICVHRCARIDCSPEPRSSQLNHLKKNKKSEPHWPDTRPTKVKFAQSWPTLRDPMDCSPLGSFVHGNLQARILEWAAISFSRGSSWPRDRTQVSCIAGSFFNDWATREALCYPYYF